MSPGNVKHPPQKASLFSIVHLLLCTLRRYMKIWPIEAPIKGPSAAGVVFEDVRFISLKSRKPHCIRYRLSMKMKDVCSRAALITGGSSIAAIIAQS